MISASKLQKLKLATERAKTAAQKQKYLKQAEVIDKQVDEKIQSVALNKFVIRKAQKLKELGKTKAEISGIILDLRTSIDAGNVDLGKLSGFGIDKKYAGKSIENILKSVDAYSKKLEVNKLKIEKKTALKVKINPDTVTENEIQKTNEKIYDYLIKQGELDVAQYVLKLMEPKNGPIKTSEIKKEIQDHTKEIKKLSLVNSGIYEELKTIREQQIDEQKTDVSVPARLRQEVKTQKQSPGKSPSRSASAGSFWDILTVMGLGSSIAYFAGLFEDDNFKKSLDLIKDGDFAGLVEHLGGLDWITGLITTAAGAALIKSAGPISSAAKVMAETKKAAKPKRVSQQKTPRTKTKSVSKLSRSAMAKGSNVVPKLMKFTKAIPFLGAAIAGGTAVYAATDGYQNADKVLGIPKNQLSETHKLAAAAGRAVEEFLWPFSPDPASIANAFLSAAGVMGINIGPKGSKPNTARQFTGINYMSTSHQSRPGASKWGGDSAGKYMGSYGYQRRNYAPTTPGKSVNSADYSITDLFTLNTDQASVNGLNPDVLNNFKAMGAEYLDMFGEKLQINSAFRSIKDQERLKQQYGSKAAAPGSSMHNYGFAVDIQSDQANKAIKAGLFDKYGFWRPVYGEQWHVEPKGIDRQGIRIAGRRQWIKDHSATPSSGRVKSDEMQKEDAPGKVVTGINYSASDFNVNLGPAMSSPERRFAELNNKKTDYVEKYGHAKGSMLFDQLHGDELQRLRQQLGVDTPTANKSKNMQNVESIQNSLVSSTVGFKNSGTQRLMQGLGETININSVNNATPSDVSVLEAFSEY